MSSAMTHSNRLPANLVLIKSNGCSIKVETTPPDIPAMKCSYLKWLSTGKTRAVPGEPLDFIADIFPVLSCSFFVIDPSAENPVASFTTLAIFASTLRHISWSGAGSVVAFTVARGTVEFASTIWCFPPSRLLFLTDYATQQNVTRTVHHHTKCSTARVKRSAHRFF